MESESHMDPSLPGPQKGPALSHHVKSRKRVVYETASVLFVICVAFYFILGASPQGASPASRTPVSSSSSPTSQATAGTTFPIASNLPELHILGVTQDNSSVKISFKPFPGAKDYRVFDVAEPAVVKYAGMARLEGDHFLMNPDGTPVVPFQENPNGTGPGVLTIPYPQIEWNLLGDNQPHTLIVQAVNQLGPIPPGNLYNDANSPLISNGGTVKTLGMNEGPTPDGHVSINGQGPSTDNPQAIAQSLPFVVQADPNLRAIPSLPNATQTFFDTFDDSEAASLKQMVPSDPENSTATYTLNAGTNREWTIQYQGADVRDSYPMIEGGHFMDVLFDGGTPGTGIPLHVEYGLMSMTPAPTVDFSSGNVLHITMEVDLHQNDRRWTGIELAPANDPLTHYDEFTGPLNHSDKALFFDYGAGACDADVYTGPSAGPGSIPNDTLLWGSDVSSDRFCDLSNFYWGGGGINLDNRGRLDLFITQTHAALFINGKLAIESDIPGGLPFTQARVYFTHYLYHTGNDIGELKQYAPWETFWINYFHWSDERHWDNMGFEVLPAGAAPTSSTWQRLVAMPNPVPPKLAPSATGGSGNGNTNSVYPPGSTVLADIPSSRNA
jgi:hypothetical protein